jgi:hypothetical protein
MTYRPITDVWFLARAKLKGGRKFYGAYLGGFPERARALLGVQLHDPVLHVCGGLARFYPYRGGFGPNDQTLDLDIDTAPDFLRDARLAFPTGPAGAHPHDEHNTFRAYLIDPPYSEADAERYPPGAAAYPSPAKLVQNGIDALPVGGRVGLIHYALPRQPKPSKFIAAVAVYCGFNNRVRSFSVFERTED